MKNRKSNFIKLGIFLFGISLLLFNCEKEEIESIDLKSKKELKLKTVSAEKAKEYFKNYQKDKPVLFARGESEKLTLDPQWETTVQDSLNFTEALLTNAETFINREGNYKSKLFFLEVNDSMNKGIYTEWIDESFENGKIKNGRIYFNDFEGKFLDAYRVNDGLITHRLLPKQQTQQASVFSIIYFFFQSTIAGDCWNFDILAEFEGGQLDEVEIISSGGGGGPGEGGSTFTSGWSYFYGNSDSSNSNSDSDGNGNSGGGGNNNNNNEENCSNGKVLNSTTNQCECPQGKVEDNSGNCITNPCTGGKEYNQNTGECNCPEGKVEDSFGNCVDKPCLGDAVSNPEIAPQTNSGMAGGLHGTCTRNGLGCPSNPNVKIHDGVDLKNPRGAPIFAMYDGIARIATQYDKKTGKITGAGYHVSITSTINGQSVRNVYFHLQENQRASGIVRAGDVIGYQGDSGNLKAAIEQKLTQSHVHVKTRVDGIMTNPLDYLATTIDPNTGQITNPCN